MTKALTLFLAQQTAAPAAPQGGPMQGLVGMLPFLLLIVGMYFLLIAPQRKKQKAHDKMVSSLDVGEEVVTTGGIYGVISSVKSDRFVVRIAENTKIEVGKSFIQAVLKKDGDGKSK
jgi:preprotein translocase subunit YajC